MTLGTFTVAVLIITLSPVMVTFKSPPSTVLTLSPFFRAEANTLPLTTWYNKSFVNCGMSLSKPARTPAGRSAKASLVGAKTVKGPTEESVPWRLAATTAVTKVDKSVVAWANCTMFMVIGVGIISTASMMWTTPFVAMTLGTFTVAVLIITLSPVMVTFKSSPSTVPTLSPFFRSEANTLPLTTWYNKSFFNCGMSLSKPARTPAGRSLKASLVGAKTVKGPTEESVPWRLAATTAVTKVDKSAVAWANCTMFMGIISTASMMWTTPFVAITLGTFTLAVLIITLSPVMVTFKFSPSTVLTLWPFFRSEANTLPFTTWYNKSFVNCGMSLSKPARTPTGRFAKASLVGAKTVKGPTEESVPWRLAATTAVTKVDKSVVAWANCTMFM